jgi:hypothetical protein
MWKPGHCADCGKAFPDHPRGFVGAAGYAATRDGKYICYDCANKRDRAQMAEASSYVAYLSGDGKKLTTWPGGELARVTSERVAPGGFSKLTYVRAVALDGTEWYGKGAGRGMVLRIHRAKARTRVA